jgi:hypothetical protein
MPFARRFLKLPFGGAADKEMCFPNLAADQLLCASARRHLQKARWYRLYAMTVKLIPVFLLAAVAIGCKSGDTTAAAPSNDTTTATTKPAAAAAGKGNFVGTWTNDSKEMMDSVVEFKPDGTMTISGTPSNAKGTRAIVTATYKVDNGNMSEQVTAMRMEAAPDADEKMKKQVEDGNKKLADPAEIKKLPTNTDKIEWKDDNTFTLTDDKGKVTTFTRKK